MTVQDTIAAAERLLPGDAVPEGDIDPRWQAVIAVEEFIETDPEPVWEFARRWGASESADLRMAIATCLLEHLLEHHFDRFIDRFEQGISGDSLFADAVAHCAQFGQAEDGARAERFHRLIRMARLQPARRSV